MKRKILSILALASFVVLGVFFLKGHTNELVKIFEVDLKYILILFVLVILSSLFSGYQFKLLMGLYKVKLTLKEWWGLRMITLFWNYLTPFKGGLSVRAVYLKKKYRFSYTSSISVTGLTYLTDFLTFGLLGAILSFFLPVSNSIKYSLLMFFTAVFLVGLFVLFFLPLPIRSDIRILRHVINSINGLQYVRTEHSLFFKLTLNSVGRTLIGALRLYFAFLAFGLTVPFYFCMMMDLFLSLAMVISITPMDLGFRESVIIISSKLFGTGALIGAFVSVLDRAVAMVFVFATAPIFSYVILNDFSIKKVGKRLPRSVMAHSKNDYQKG